MPILRISRRPKERILNFFPLFSIVFYILDCEHCQVIALQAGSVLPQAVPLPDPEHAGYQTACG